MKLRRNVLLGSLLLGGILSISLYSIGSSMASGMFEYSQRDVYRNKYDEDDHYSRSQSKASPIYIEECGSCHMAYPAMLLPTESWQQIMSDLEEHYGENAELDANSVRDIEYYLVNNSRPMSKRKKLRKTGVQIPMRISELPYFIREHDEIPSRYVEGNDNIGSFSQCNSCHTNADQGDFDEDNIVIPGIGRWDD